MNSRNFFNSASILANIPSQFLQRDCPTSRIITVRHRGTIYRQGEPATSVFCVLNGQVTIARTTNEGSLLTTALFGAGDFFGAALSGTEKNDDTARAKGAVSIWRAPIAEFRALLRNQPDAAWEFAAALARRQKQSERKLEGLAFKRVEVRLAETFRELSGGFAMRCEHGFGQHLRLSQQELADLVGATRPVVSTILNRLRDKGVLGYNREYVCVRRIDDIEQLIES
jgi:CRP-like cAMP-binding protein